MPTPHALLLSKPSVNFPDFFRACHEALGYSVASVTDACSYEMKDTQKLLWSLAAFQDKEVRVGPTMIPSLLPHASLSILVFADERDMLDILQCCSGMPFVVAETVDSRALAVVITGTLAQWRDAVASGCQREAELAVRAGFNKIYNLLRGENLNLWSYYNTREAPNETFYLECKVR